MPPLSDSLRRRGLALRGAGRSDLPGLRRLFGCVRSLELALVPWAPAQKEAFLDDQFRLQHAHFVRHHAKADFWIVEQAKPLEPLHAAGRLYLDRSGESWRIVDISLFAEARGSGLGGALIAWVQEEAAATGKGVALQVAENNPRARALYLRMGFADAGPAAHGHQPMMWRPPA